MPAHHPDLHSFPTRRSSDLKRRQRMNKLAMFAGVVFALGLTPLPAHAQGREVTGRVTRAVGDVPVGLATIDRKSTRLNSSHRCISYAVFCLKKKNEHKQLAQ